MKRWFVLLLLCACTGSKGPPADRFDGLDGLDVKSDAFSSRIRIVGPIQYGDTLSVPYTRSPRYRALAFKANPGDRIAIAVRSSDGDPVAFLLDDGFSLLAWNDDADANTTDSALEASLDQGGAHYIAMRDYWLQPATFQVTLRRDSGDCQPAFEVPDDPPVSLGNVEWLVNHFASSHHFAYGDEPACLDFQSAEVQARLADELGRLSPPFAAVPTATPVVAGGGAFAERLRGTRTELDSRASSRMPPTDPTWMSLYPHASEYIESVIGDADLHPEAYLELRLHFEAEECSVERYLRIDTRSGEVLLLDVHGC
jgi:hypothetical protein